MTSDWIPPDSFGTRLLVMRRGLELTQEEAAERCGINAKTWATWELGKTPRDMANVVARISQAVGVDRDWLMWGEVSRSRCLSPLGQPEGQLELGFDVPRDLALVH